MNKGQTSSWEPHGATWGPPGIGRAMKVLLGPFISAKSPPQTIASPSRLHILTVYSSFILVFSLSISPTVQILPSFLQSRFTVGIVYNFQRFPFSIVYSLMAEFLLGAFFIIITFTQPLCTFEKKNPSPSFINNNKKKKRNRIPVDAAAYSPPPLSPIPLSKSCISSPFFLLSVKGNTSISGAQ